MCRNTLTWEPYYLKLISNIKKTFKVKDKSDRWKIETVLVISLIWLLIHFLWLKYEKGTEIMFRLGGLLEWVVPAIFATTLFYYIFSYLPSKRMNKTALLSLFRYNYTDGLLNICNSIYQILELHLRMEINGNTEIEIKSLCEEKYKYNDFRNVDNTRYTTGGANIYIENLKSQITIIKTNSQLYNCGIYFIIINLEQLVNSFNLDNVRPEDLYRFYIILCAFNEWLKFYKIWNKTRLFNATE